MQISEKAIQAVLDSPRLRSRLMMEFNKTEVTVKNWANKRSWMLTTPDAVRVIEEETGLTGDQILVEKIFKKEKEL